MRRMLRENDLTLVMLGLIMACLIGRVIGGFTGHFTEAVSKNRESEFLQMGMLVFLAAFLFQIEVRSVPGPIRAAPEHLGTKCERQASWVYHVLADRRPLPRAGSGLMHHAAAA